MLVAGRSRRIGVLSHESYLRLRQEVERARLAGENAREELTAHAGEHGCRRPDALLRTE